MPSLFFIARERSWPLCALGLAVGLWGFSTAITGMVGEYLVRMNYEIGRKPKYLVRKIHGDDKATNRQAGKLMSPKTAESD